MALVTGALPSVITKLGHLLIGEYKLQKEVKGGIIFLQAELETMNAALEKISETPADKLDKQDKIWARNVRELSYDIEDKIDTFMVRCKGGKLGKQHGFKKVIDTSLDWLAQPKIRRKIATDIREIKVRVEEVAQRRDRYNICSDTTKPVTIDPRLFVQHKNVKELVGIDEAREEVTKILMEGSEASKQQHKIVSIVGFGGLGKTTLANVVYEQIRENFDCSAFVSVSQTPDMETLLKDMLYQLSKRRSDASITIIIKELTEFLREKSIFPEDFEIDKDALIWKWIAEGFVRSEKEGKSFFELGEGYFNELINRSMIQPMHSKHNNDSIGCRVHDMVLDLIGALSSEENFVTILNDMDHTSPSSRIRRLSLQYAKTLDRGNWTQVRSVIVFPSVSDLVPSLESFQVLRVLELKGCDFSQDYNLKYLANLFHLRYLGLHGTRITMIPEEIGNLQFLQTLDAAGNEIPSLPSTVLQLRNLMCVHTDYSTRVPSGFGNLSCLEVLSWLYIDDSTMGNVEELGQLTKLRVLRICYKANWNGNLVGSLCKLQKIQKLRIIGRNYPLDSVGGLDAWVAPRHLHLLDTRGACWFSTLPVWMNDLSLVSQLSILNITVNELREDDLEILGRLPTLRSLGLEVDHKKLELLGSRFIVDAGSFPCLVICRLRGLVGLVEFRREAMLRLKQLFLRLFYVRQAREIVSSNGDLDFGLGNMPSLQYVDVELYSGGASNEELKDVKAALRRVAKMHPNHPTYNIGIGINTNSNEE